MAKLKQAGTQNVTKLVEKYGEKRPKHESDNCSKGGCGRYEE